MVALREEWMPQKRLEILDWETARYIGVNPRLTGEVIAEYLMRQAFRPGETAEAVHIPASVGGWFISLANHLGGTVDYDGIARGPLEEMAGRVADQSVHESQPSERP